MSSEPPPLSPRRPAWWPLAAAAVLTTLACRQIGKVTLQVSLHDILLVREAARLGAAWGLFFGLAVSAMCWGIARRCWRADPDDSPSVMAPTVLGGLFIISPVLVTLLILADILFTTGALPTLEMIRTRGPLAAMLGLLFALVLGLFAAPVAAAIWQGAVWAARRWRAPDHAQPPAPYAPAPDAPPAPRPRLWPLAAATLLVSVGYMYACTFVFARFLARPPADPAATGRLSDVLGLLLGATLSILAWRKARRAWADDPACLPPVAQTVLLGGVGVFAVLLAVPALLALFAWLLGPFANAPAIYATLREGALVILRLGLILGLVVAYLAGIVWTMAVRLARPRV
ncbi:MAG: hypothetical protein NTV86_12585 [Planctomycetota bacterium]|nr:hypothetical protein [Planctomycetota bacterium]